MENLRLTFGQAVGLISFSAILACGQLLFKHASAAVDERGGAIGIISQILLQPGFWIGGSLYAAATVLWIWLLSRIPLSIAYPISAFSFVIVPILSWFLFSEPISIRYWVGLSLIIVGVLVIVRP